MPNPLTEAERQAFEDWKRNNSANLPDLGPARPESAFAAGRDCALKGAANKLRVQANLMRHSGLDYAEWLQAAALIEQGQP